MFKKAIPLVLMSGLVLTACTNNNTVPKNNETPMEKVEDRTRDITPEVNDGQTGPNMDGLDNNRDMNGNDVINGNNGNNGNNGGGNGVMNGNTTTPNQDVINDNTTTPNEMIIDEKVNKNGNNR